MSTIEAIAVKIAPFITPENAWLAKLVGPGMVLTGIIMLVYVATLKEIK